MRKCSDLNVYFLIFTIWQFFWSEIWLAIGLSVWGHMFASGYTCERPWRSDRALGGLLYYSGRSLPEPGLVFSRLDWNPASSGAPPVYTFRKGGVTGVCENPVCFMGPGTQTLVPVIVNQALSLWAISPAHMPFGSSFYDIRCSICPIWNNLWFPEIHV